MPTYEVDYWIRFYNGTITIEAETEAEALNKIDLPVFKHGEKLLDGLDVEWDIDDIREV